MGYSKRDGARKEAAQRRRRRARTARRLRRVRRREMARRDAWVSREYGRAGHGSCGRKVRYETEEKAMRRAIMSMLRSEEGAVVTAYPCPYCGGWHLTSHPRKSATGPEGTPRESE